MAAGPSFEVILKALAKEKLFWFNAAILWTLKAPDGIPSNGITVNVNYEFNDVELPEGSFETKLYRVVADTQFSPFMYLVNNIQFDTVSGLLGWQSRFR